MGLRLSTISLIPLCAHRTQARSFTSAGDFFTKNLKKSLSLREAGQANVFGNSPIDAKAKRNLRLSPVG